MPDSRGTQAAAVAIGAYERSLGESGARDEKEGIVDLITDLLHYGDEVGLNVASLLRTATTHYEDEAGPIKEGRRRR